ncbi:hypothetical protein [Dyadobacter fermentans]|uniref:hypothetical protein n=1 Tax=Dyadobacter fermentans TaxID=94254 RepID=UPI001CBB50F9|nr:hypothetical protein [Dyadobacter fermentans]MBZ1362473.1 hypothetical protein [Dyadobacter fermentans]
MAKPRSKAKEPATIPDDLPGYQGIIIAVIKENGLVGLFVVFCLWFLHSNATATQKGEIIDSFVLMKGIDKNPYPAIAVFILLIATIILQHVYYSLRVKVFMQEKKQLRGEISQLQSLQSQVANNQ